MMIADPPVKVEQRAPTVDLQVLLVEDEEITRIRLSKLLERRGIKVVQAGTAYEALDRAMNARASIILMDIQMGEDSDDGIDVGQKIMAVRPDSAIIFVTAYADQAPYRQRARVARLPVAEWFAKPIWSRLDDVVGLIEQEELKVKMKLSLERALAESVSLPDRLRQDLRENPAISPELVSKVLDWLDLQEKVDTDVEIRLLYVALEYFADRVAEEPALRSRTEPLLNMLKAFEEREADEFERHFVARFRVKPGEVTELYDWGRRLLKE